MKAVRRCRRFVHVETTPSGTSKRQLGPFFASRQVFSLFVRFVLPTLLLVALSSSSSESSVVSYESPVSSPFCHLSFSCRPLALHTLFRLLHILFCSSALGFSS